MWAIIGDQDVRVYTDALVRLMRAVQCAGCADGPHPGWGCTACPARGTVTQLRVEYEPAGHTVPPSAGPRSTFRALATWIAQRVAPDNS